MTTKRKPSPLNTVLRAIFNTRGTYTRKEWAQLLRVHPSMLEDWLDSALVPSPENLRTIMRTLREDKRFNRVSEQLEQVLDLPTWKSVNYAAPYLGVTLRHYTVLPLKEGFLRSLSTLSPRRQEEVLYSASALCHPNPSSY